MTQKGEDLLAKVCKSRENLDVNFEHHAQLVQLRDSEYLPKMVYVGVACLLHQNNVAMHESE